MSDILQRLGRLVESLFENNPQSARQDPDGEFARAWQELDASLKAGWKDFSSDDSAFDDMDRSFAEFDRLFENATGRKPDPAPDSRTGNRERPGQNFQGKQTSMNDDELRKTAEKLVEDYRNLEIKPGASLDEVRSAYKRLMKMYHPDRFAHSAEKQKIAHQVSVKLNESYQRILKYLE